MSLNLLKLLKLKKTLQILAISTSFAALVACSSTGTGANAAGGANTGVQTSGLGSGNLLNPNAMVPGADQKYYFDYNQSTVHDSDMPSIRLQAQYLVSHPTASVLIAGNTDIRGSREYNIALGQRRADALASILKLQGVSASQIRTISYGAEKPVATGDDEADYAQNRRDDMIYQSH
jgi:peptidoglycan-associated lipoprotein